MSNDINAIQEIIQCIDDREIPDPGKEISTVKVTGDEARKILSERINRNDETIGKILETIGNNLKTINALTETIGGLISRVKKLESIATSRPSVNIG